MKSSFLKTPENSNKKLKYVEETQNSGIYF